MKTINEIIGENVKMYRKKREFTQQELGDRADLHITFISQIESGKKICSVKSLKRLAKALDVNPETLLIPHQGRKQIIDFNKKTKELVSIASKLPDSKKDLLISIAKAVASK